MIIAITKDIIIIEFIDHTCCVVLINLIIGVIVPEFVGHL